MKILCNLLLIFKLISASPTPIVLWHGMGDTCCFTFSLGAFQQYLKDQIPGVYVKSLSIGKDPVEDFENGYLMHPNKQIDIACNKLATDVRLKDGFNAIGFSQGSQFLRGVVQRCGHKLPPIKKLISLGGQHQGVYGLPHCFALAHATCDYIRKLLNYAAYSDWVQKFLVQATYWHDPLNENAYIQKSQFLADINNEKTINETYIKNLKKLEHFVMVKFSNDTIVQPIETEWFGFYAPGQSTKIRPLQNSEIYTKDRLGLKAMDKAGKLVFLSFPADHLKFSEEWFTANIINHYLKQVPSY